MASNLLARLSKSPVLCDGAMGTLLYSKGIFINRCYDELNLSQPDLIQGVHHEYLQAGAEIIDPAPVDLSQVRRDQNAGVCMGFKYDINAYLAAQGDRVCGVLRAGPKASQARR